MIRAAGRDFGSLGGVAAGRGIPYNHRVQQPYRRAIAVCIAIIACALVFSLAIGPSVSVRGVVGPTIRAAESPVRAMLAVAGCLALSTVVACVVGRLINAVVGLFVLGCGVGLLAMRSGTILDVAFGGIRIIDLAIEGFAWALVVLVLSAIVFRASGPLPDQVEIEEPAVDGPLGARGFVSQLAGVVILPVVWLLIASPAKGQALGAVVVGATLAGLAGRLLAPKTPPVLLFAAPLVFASIAYVVAHFMVGQGQTLDALYVSRSAPRFAFPMPIDYAAGSLAGVAIGIGWARSFLKPHPATA